MTDGYDKPTAYGSIEGFDDPSMGWSRYAQFYKRFNMNSGLFYVRASTRTVDLMTRLEVRSCTTSIWVPLIHHVSFVHTCSSQNLGLKEWNYIT